MRHAASNRSARIGPVRRASQSMSTGGRARRRLQESSSLDITSVPARTLVRHPNERSPDRTSTRPSARSSKVRAGHATVHKERSADRRIGPSRSVLATAASADRSSARSEGGRRASRVDRASRRARLAASVWLLRCLSPRSYATATPELGERGGCRGSPRRWTPPGPVWAMAAAGPPSRSAPWSVQPPTSTLAHDVPRINI